MISYEETYPVRQAVLWPQKTLAQVGLHEDPDGLHLGKRMPSGQLVGVVSIFFVEKTAQFKKFAVLEAYQTQGIGSLLLQAVKRTASLHQCTKIICDSRQSAVPFYVKHGFEAEYDFLKYEKMYTRMGHVL